MGKSWLELFTVLEKKEKIFFFLLLGCESHEISPADYLFLKLEV